MLMLRANLKEDNKYLMACFIVGLNSKIGELVEVQHYLEMKDLMGKAIKIEKQLKVKRPRGFTTRSSRPLWRETQVIDKKESRDAPKPREGVKSEVEASKSQPKEKAKSSQRQRKIRCFKS